MGEGNDDLPQAAVVVNPGHVYYGRAAFKFLRRKDRLVHVQFPDGSECLLSQGLGAQDGPTEVLLVKTGPELDNLVRGLPRVRSSLLQQWSAATSKDVKPGCRLGARNHFRQLLERLRRPEKAYANT